MRCTPLLCFILPTDDAATIFVKKLIMISVLSCMVMIGLSIISVGGNTFIQARRVATVVIAASVGAQLVIEKKVRFGVLEAFLYFMGVVFCMGDLVVIAAMVGERKWPFFILMIDVCLVCKMPTRVSTILIAMLLTWHLVVTAESSFRFGLFDLFFLASQEDRFEAVDCTELPCKVPVTQACIGFASKSMIFLLDFYFTRGFAYDLQKEHDKMNKVITAAEQISTSLSRFDLTAAESVINDASLPDPLYDSFNRILCNLHIYRPYLPQSCFQGEDFTDSSECGGEKSPSDSDSFASTKSFDSSVAFSENKLESTKALEATRALEKKRCTFTVANMLGSHSEASRDIVAYQVRYKEFMEEVLSCYSRVSGVVSVVVGDHVHVSFNAVRRCVSHAVSAIQGTMDLHTGAHEKGIDVVTGVASGTAFCGPLGCAELMSVGVIGPSAVVASVVQDFARAQGLKVACSGSVYSEVSHAFTMRIVLETVGVVGSKAVELGYEVLVESNDKEKVEEEWMYQLEERPWDSYNTAGKQYLLGNVEEALRVLRIERVRSEEVLVAETVLVKIIERGITWN